MKKKIIFCASFLCALSLVSALSISEIQGIYHASAMKGHDVEDVEGVVTAVVKHPLSRGFYMQSLQADSDARTSEGIWVECEECKAKAGDLVKVSGMVDEIQLEKAVEGEMTVTAIKARNVDIIKSNCKVKPFVIKGNKIPKKIHEGPLSDVLDIKKNAMDFYESLEGMLVQVNSPVVVGANESHGEVCVIPDGGKSCKDRTKRGGVKYSYENEQTSRIILNPALFPLTENRVFKNSSFTPNPGDRFASPISGVLTFIYMNYQLINTSPLPPLKDVGASRDKNRYAYDASCLNAAVYNIENFTIADGGEERVKVLSSHVKEDLKLPDILGLVEVGDDDGGNVESNVLTSEKTLEAIVSGILKESGVEYGYLCVNPEDKKDGGWPAMHIRNAVLYRKDTMEVPYFTPSQAAGKDTKFADGKLTFNPGRIGNDEPFFADVRKTLVAHLKMKKNGKDVFVLVNHLKSKRADDKLYSAKRPVKRSSEDVRIPEGKYVNAFLKKINEKLPEAILLCMGDMNDFEFSPTIKEMKGDFMVSAVETLPVNERHTYVYQGSSQILDNFLVNSRYAKGLKCDILNINSEFTRAQGYFSDHDPIFVQIKTE